MKGQLKKITALLLAVLMIMGTVGTVFAGEVSEEPKKKILVSFGDSMTNGFGLEESEEHTEETLFDQPFGYDSSVHNGYLEISTEAYPWKVSQEYGWDLIQLAVSGARAEDFHYILDFDYENGVAGEYKGDVWTMDRIINDQNRWSSKDEDNNKEFDIYGLDSPYAQRDWSGEWSETNNWDVTNVAKVYQESVKNADVISLALGNCNLGVFLFGIVASSFGVFGNSDDYPYATFENAIKDLDAETQASLTAMYVKLQERVHGLISDQKLADKLLNAVTYTLVSYILNYTGLVDRIIELNPDAEIVIVGMMNTICGAKFKLEDGTIIDLGEDIMVEVIDPINNFMTTYPTYKQLTGEYSEASFYYAESDSVETIVETFKTLNIRENTVMRDRYVKDFLGDLGKFFPDGYGPVEFTYKDVAAYEDAVAVFEEDNTKLNDYVDEVGEAKAKSIAMYLAFEKALIASTESPITLSAIEAFTTVDGGADVFGALIVDYRTNLETTIRAINAKEEEEKKAAEEKGEEYVGAMEALGTAIVTEKVTPLITARATELFMSGPPYNTSIEIAKAAAYNEIINNEEIMKPIKEEASARVATIYGYYYTPELLSAALLSDEAVSGLLNAYTRMMFGDGLSSHPSSYGHDQLTAAFLEAYDGKYTAFDKVEDDMIHPALDELKEYYLNNKSEVNDKIYNYLLNNPETVIAFIEENQGNPDRMKAGIAVMAYAYDYYGGQEAVDKMLADPEGTFNTLVDLVLTHGDNAYRLVKTYLIAAELTPEDYENAFEYLVEVLKEYGPGIAQGIYDWAESEGYIAEIEKAVEEFTGIVEEDVVAFVETVQPKIEKAIAELEKFIAEKEAQSAELKAKLETEIVPEIERLNAELKEKKAQYDVVMAHIDEYHPEEKEAVINALKAEIAELEAQIANDEAIKAQIEEAVNNISEEAEDVKAVAKEIEAKIAELGKEAEKLAVVSEELIKAVEKLAKVSVENIDEATVEEEISAIIADLQTAAEEMLRTLKDAWTFTELGTGIANAAIKLGESLQTKAEKYEEVIGPEVEAVVNELTKLVDGSTPEATVILEAMLGDVKELASISEELAKEIADVAEVTVKEAEKLVKVIAEEVEKSVKYLENAVKTAYLNAITGEYVYTKDAYYVNLGDSIGKGENNYAEKVAAELGLEEEYKDYSYENFRTEDFRYILDEDYEGDAYSKAVVGNNREALRKEITAELRKADFITVGTGNLTPFVMAQIAKSLEKNSEPYEMDWAKLVGEDHVQYVEMALAEVEKYINETELPEIPYANIIGNYINTDIREIVMTAAESYAYAYAGFAFNYTELANVIHEINPEAEVVLVGSYNALDGLEMDGTNFGEYVDYLVELMDMQFTAYGMLTDKTTFVEVNETKVEKPVASITDLVMSIIPQLDLGLPSFVTSIIQNMIGTDGAELNPSEEGHEYIKEQIFDAMSVTYGGGLGDVNLDGEVDAKDATQILRYVNAKTSVFTTYKGHKAELAKALADVDYYPGIEARDATQILRYCNAKTNTIEGRQ